MANFFQPGDSKGTQNTSTTPSPADQAMAKFRAEILAHILNYQGQPRTGFAQFAGGAPMSAKLPANLGAGLPDLLQAMSQPGAFTRTASQDFSGHGATPSMASDVGQGLGLLALLSQSGILGAGAKGAGDIFDFIRGLPSSNLQSQSSMPTSTGAFDASMLGNLGTVGSPTDQVPYASAGDSGANLLANILGYGSY
jgi:hypothetical protein